MGCSPREVRWYFLRFPDWLWRLASSHRGMPNRRRKSDFLKLIAKFGLTLDQMVDVVRLSPEQVREARAYLQESQISDEDVGGQQIFFTARKARPELGEMTAIFREASRRRISLFSPFPWEIPS